MILLTGQRGPASPSLSPKGILMLGWSITFLVVAILAGVLGFSGIAGTASSIAWVLFGLFIILFVVSFILNTVRGKGSGAAI